MVKFFINPASLGLVLLLCSVFNIGVLAMPKRSPPPGQHLKRGLPVMIRKSSPMVIVRRSEPLSVIVRKTVVEVERRNTSDHVTRHEKKEQQLVQLVPSTWTPAAATDSRSPCPVLNMLANHKYIHHDGRNLIPSEVSSVLQKVLNLSPSLADSLLSAVDPLLSSEGTFELHDLALHGLIEHDASLVHQDAGGYHWRRRWLRGTYAPVTPDPLLLSQLIADSSDGKSLTLADFAKARVRRENDIPNALTAEVRQFVQGEPSLLLGVFGGKSGEKGDEGWSGKMSIKSVRQLFGEEKMPDEFVRITKPLTLKSVIRGQQRVASYMGKIKAILAHAAAVSSSAQAKDTTPTASTA